MGVTRRTVIQDRPPEMHSREIGASQVYFAYSAGHIKIGTSNNPHHRHVALVSSSPVPGCILFTLEGGRPEEKAFHKRFADLHVTGEWFLLDGALREYVTIELARRVGGVIRLQLAEDRFFDWVERHRRPQTVPAEAAK